MLQCMLFALGSLVIAPVWAMSVGPVDETELKAAYLYNFAMFTTWPSDNAARDTNFNVCVAADSKQFASIAALQTRKMREFNILVREVNAPEEVANCHVLFVSEKAGELGMRMMDAVRDRATLTITDAADGSRKSAVISVGVDEGRLAFDVNLQNARRARLNLSSKLLKLARSTN